jgi:hypothetical protein
LESNAQCKLLALKQKKIIQETSKKLLRRRLKTEKKNDSIDDFVADRQLCSGECNADGCNGDCFG